MESIGNILKREAVVQTSFNSTTLIPAGFYPEPYSMGKLTHDLRVGLWFLAFAALLSVVACSMLFGWITYRLVSWRKHYRSYVGYNQYVILIYNLLLADLQQSLGFLISFVHLSQDDILAPSPACFGQAWLVHIGDLSSGFFVLIIALHTWVQVVQGRRISYKAFLSVILGAWVLSLVLTIIGPGLYGQKFYTRAGAWCWASQDFEADRLWLHYLWIFIIEFGTVILYALIFLFLRKQTMTLRNTVSHADTKKVSRATIYMVLYPLVYVLCTLPLAAARMAAMTGNELPIAYYCFAGACMTSCGWLDTVLYTATRRVLVNQELTGAGRETGSHGRGGTHREGWESMSMDAVPQSNGTRTVTITGGKFGRSSLGAANTLGNGKSGADRGRSGFGRGGRNPARRGSSVSLRNASPSGSTDSMLKRPGVGFGEVKAETKVEVTIQSADSTSERTDEESPKRGGGTLPWNR